MDQKQIETTYRNNIKPAFISKIQEILNALGVEAKIYEDTCSGEFSDRAHFEREGLQVDIEAFLWESDQNDGCADPGLLAIEIKGSTYKDGAGEIAFDYSPYVYTDLLWISDIGNLCQRVTNLDAAQCAKQIKEYF
jgi:hypothetical protein